jgi:ABC-type sugar transport system ATPase subunit
MANIVFEDVQKIYPDGTQAVFDLDMEIEDGEFVIFVGPSGCGKSTVLRMVAGLEDISGGKISIGDKVVNDLTPKERDIAMVFQSYALYPHMSVADNMGFALKLSKTPKAEIDKRVNEAAEILGLTEYLHRKPKALSGGQRQRVAMGRAIVRNPQAFLMDEPLSNLDAKLRVQMRAEIADLQSRLGTTTLYVTHDQVEAMTMGDRVAVLKAGRLEQVDAPQRLYDHPDTIFVAGFMGSPSMNIAEAELAADGDTIYVEFEGGGIRLRVAEEAIRSTRRSPTTWANGWRSGCARSTSPGARTSPRTSGCRGARSGWSRCWARRCSCTSRPVHAPSSPRTCVRRSTTRTPSRSSSARRPRAGRTSWPASTRTIRRPPARCVTSASRPSTCTSSTRTPAPPCADLRPATATWG